MCAPKEKCPQPGFSLSMHNREVLTEQLTLFSALIEPLYQTLREPSWARWLALRGAGTREAVADCSSRCKTPVGALPGLPARIQIQMGPGPRGSALACASGAARGICGAGQPLSFPLRVLSAPCDLDTWK